MADVPETIGKYKIVSLVAKGGMGAVYKAVHPTLKRHVIIKKLTIRGNATMVERFKREAQILMDLDDPRVVHLFDYFKEGTSHYIVLEFVDGMSLDALIKKRRYLSGPLSLYIFLDACKALKYAHERGIIHRDIKPANILISKTGTVKLADFGIATTDEEEDEGLTKEGMTLGTASYMPPEQFKNSKNVDKRADIYAMGVMLYEMVTGKRPFPGNFAPDTLVLIQKGRYVSPKRLNPDIPKIVAKLVKRMIKPNPRKRFQDMAPVIRIIERYLARFQTDALHSCLVAFMAPANAEEPAFKPRARKRVVVPSLLAFLVLLGGLFYKAWDEGYVHRYALASSYGELAVSVRFPADMKAPEDVFLLARIYENDGAEFPESPVSPVAFALVDGTDEGVAHRFESRALRLKPGRYRMKVMAEQRVYWKSFVVRPLRSRGEEGLTTTAVSIGFDDVRAKPVSVRTEAYDAVNGRNITSLTRFRTLEGVTWTALGELPSETISSGTVRKFRAESPGYYAEDFSLRIAPGQTELVLQANLVPLPGTLTITAPDGRLRLAVNGRESMPLGGVTMEESPLADYSGGKKSWSVPSGNYEIDVGTGSRAARAAFSVMPGEETRITVAEANGTYRITKE